MLIKVYTGIVMVRKGLCSMPFEQARPTSAYEAYVKAGGAYAKFEEDT